MNKDQILLSINTEIDSTRKELGETDKSERALFNGRIEGLRYARSLVLKFGTELQLENKEVTPTKEQKYDFVNDNLKKLTKGKKQNVVMDGRVYEIKYKGIESEVFIPFKDVSNQ